MTNPNRHQGPRYATFAVAMTVWTLAFFACPAAAWNETIQAQIVRDAIRLSPPEVRRLFQENPKAVLPAIQNLSTLTKNGRRGPNEHFATSLAMARHPSTRPGRVVRELVALSAYPADALRPAAEPAFFRQAAMTQMPFVVRYDGHQPVANLKRALDKANRWARPHLDAVAQAAEGNEIAFPDEARESLNVLYNIAVNETVDAWTSFAAGMGLDTSTDVPAGRTFVSRIPYSRERKVDPGEAAALKSNMEGFVEAVYGTSEKAAPPAPMPVTPSVPPAPEPVETPEPVTEPASPPAPEPAPVTVPEPTPDITPEPEPPAVEEPAAPLPEPAFETNDEGGFEDFGDDSGVWDLIGTEDSTPKASVTGDFQNRFTLDTVPDNDEEDYATTRSILYGKLIYPLTRDISISVGGLVEYIYRVDRDWLENGSRYRVELEELYFDFHVGDLDLRIGQQLVEWAVCDVVSVVDIINPYSLQHVVDEELGHARVGNLMVKADYYTGDARTELILTPFFRPARIDFIGGDWALLGSRFPVPQLVGYVDESALGRGFLAYLNDLYPDWAEDTEEALSTEQINAFGTTHFRDNLEYWEAAARMYLNLGPATLSMLYMYGFDDLPVLKFRPEVRRLFEAFAEGRDPSRELLDAVEELGAGGLAEADYRRVNHVGGTVSANLGPSVLRVEALLTTGRLQYTERLDVVDRPTFTWTASIDYTFPHGIVANVQVLQNQTLFYRSDLLVDERITLLIAYLRGTFFSDQFEARATTIYNVTNWTTEDWSKGEMFGEDYQFEGKLAYSDRKNVKVGLGAMLFGGPEDQILGQIKDKSFYYLDLKVSF